MKTFGLILKKIDLDISDSDDSLMIKAKALGV